MRESGDAFDDDDRRAEFYHRRQEGRQRRWWGGGGGNPPPPSSSPVSPQPPAAADADGRQPHNPHHHNVHGGRSPASSPPAADGSSSSSPGSSLRAGPRRIHHHHASDVPTLPLPLTPSIWSGSYSDEVGGGTGPATPGRTLVLDHHRRRGSGRPRTCMGTSVRIAALIVVLVCALSGPALTLLRDGWHGAMMGGGETDAPPHLFRGDGGGGGGGGASSEMVTPRGPSFPRMKQQALASITATATTSHRHRGDDSDRDPAAASSSRQELLEEAVLLLAANVQRQGGELDDLRDIVRRQADSMTGLLGGLTAAAGGEQLAVGGEQEGGSNLAEADPSKREQRREGQEEKPPLPAPGNNKRSAQRRKKLPYVNPNNSDRKPPLNIVLLYADDWRHDTLGCAGTNPIVKTPNLDALARRGVRFANNCVTTSVCWISRATLLTGQYLSRHGNQRIADARFHDTWNETLFGLLNDAGYHTGFVGKWHNGCDPSNAGVGGGGGVGVDGEVDGCGLGFDFQRLYYGVHWEWDRIEKRNMHVTEMNERDALHFLRNRPRSSSGAGGGGGGDERPFALTVSFFATHAEDGNPKQYLPQEQSMELYVDDTVPIPITANNESFAKLPPFFTERNEGRKRYHWRYDTPEKHQTMMKNYYRMATEVDTACGNIMKELERQGVLNETFIIFTTDNGNFHAEHGLADKWYPHQESIRVPLIIYDPRMSGEKVGTVNDVDFTLNIDLAPTIVSAAGITVPERMQGRDMSELYLDRRKAGTEDGGGGGTGAGTGGASKREEEGGDGGAWRDEFYYEYPSFGDAYNIPASQALVRRDYKYVLWPEFGTEQLFHLEEDPLEERDLFSSESEVVMGKIVEMRKRMAELKEAAL